MNSWYEVVISDTGTTLGMTAEEVIHVFMTSARAQIMHSGNPKEAEIFSNNVPIGSAARNRVYFFAPKAAEIIDDLLNEYGGKPCRKPDTDSPLLVKVWGQGVAGWYPG